MLQFLHMYFEKKKRIELPPLIWKYNVPVITNNSSFVPCCDNGFFSSLHPLPLPLYHLKLCLVFEQIGQGGEVPLSYYKQQMLSADIDNAVCVSVGRGSSLQVECEVAVKNSAIR